MTDIREPNTSAQRYVYLVQQPNAPESPAADVSLQNLWQLVWKKRSIVAAFVVICSIAGTTYAFLVSPWYKAEVVLSPVNEKSISGSLSSLGGLGDLAGLAGISIPMGRGGAPMAVLKSKGFARDFIEDQKLMPVLFASKWDAGKGDWKIKGPEQPDIRDGVRYFDETIRIVTEDKKAGVVTLAINWKDPSEASRWANLLVRRLNDRMRSEAIHEAENSIGYLQKELLSTNVVSLQNSIGRVLESEMQKMALARANEQFAFKVVDEAFPPKKRYFPQRTLIAVTSALFGGILGVIYVALSQLWHRQG